MFMILANQRFCGALNTFNQVEEGGGHATQLDDEYSDEEGATAAAAAARNSMPLPNAFATAHSVEVEMVATSSASAGAAFEEEPAAEYDEDAIHWGAQQN